MGTAHGQLGLGSLSLSLLYKASLAVLRGSPWSPLRLEASFALLSRPRCSVGLAVGLASRPLEHRQGLLAALGVVDDGVRVLRRGVAALSE